MAPNTPQVQTECTITSRSAHRSQSSRTSRTQVIILSFKRHDLGRFYRRQRAWLKQVFETKYGYEVSDVILRPGMPRLQQNMILKAFNQVRKKFEDGEANLLLFYYIGHGGIDTDCGGQKKLTLS